ncbi:2-oxo-4-hydroxy-4-carboxy-5-ureidoimidazoline decarboxylase [Kozakia baliensis]|uniref:2-oxo-4-hydroxy-4-carboxy-5-ureidoimidazoline decarboxylase n=1 Tax=Kozakia baliensis TaxID=153496 RepID=UPI00087C16A7|nr:2-oxo-4-hydroxy-4-carboxy-5-ureidoimidazoline decarboxylase [Kozakia baliensis]AOX19401.1 OHCU decarboxylase [Kozakia baliensis]
MIDAASEEVFVARFGDLYEHSPWIAREAWRARPFADADAFLAALSAVVRRSGEKKQRALVQAHPELARKFGVDSELGRLSASEQAGAGLDRLSPEEFTQFRALNDAYRARFDMPFVICVRKADKASIRSELERRLAQSLKEELEEALRQIDQIAALRLKDKLAS